MTDPFSAPSITANLASHNRAKVVRNPASESPVEPHLLRPSRHEARQ